ncbi:hypothetical protein [Mycobacterium sp.]|uniref:hypothetical protein n=1 Tax=Mycobacterium sp. TaxID=1785 RepID=UPI003D6B08C9
MTMPAPTTYAEMLPVHFEPPLVNPAPGGLYPNVLWTDVGLDEASRHLTGVEVRNVNFPGDAATGVWSVPWCGVPDLDGERKEGERGGDLPPFEPVVAWAFDSCDLTAPSRAEVEQRASQALRLRESVMVAREFAERLKLDAADLGATGQVDNVVDALAGIEGEFAEANVLGYVHLSPEWLPVLVSAQLVARSGTKWTTPGGHALVLDGGYRDGLGQTMIATSAPLFGWRDQPQVRTSLDERRNLYIAIAERSVLVSYEEVIAAVEVTQPEPAP